MGSSSVSCALTGITLANQPAVLIPLAPSRYPSGGDRRFPSAVGGAQVVSNEGSAALFGALALPLIGRVGDYGDLEDLREDANVRFLRDRFGDEFDDFIEGVTRGGHTNLTNKIARKVGKTRYRKNRPAWDGNLSGCWIAKKAWDKFSTQAWNEDGSRRESVGTDGWLDPKNLQGMGFKPQGEDKSTATALFGSGPHEGDRYYYPYTHGGIPDLTVWCDDHMSSKASYKGAKIEIGLQYDNFVKALKKLGVSLPLSLTKWAMRTSVYRGHLLEARESRDKGIARDAEMEAFYNAHPDARWSPITEGSDADTQVFCSRRYGMNTGRHYHIIIKSDGTHSVTGCASTKDHGSNYSFDRDKFKFTPEVWETITALKKMGWRQPKQERLYTGFDNPYVRGFPEETLHLYGEAFLSNALLPLTERFLCLEGNMYAANRLLAPTTGGWQCGNNATQREVAEMALRLVRARERRYRR